MPSNPIRLAGQVARVAVVAPPASEVARPTPVQREAAAARQAQQQAQEIVQLKGELSRALSALASGLGQMPALRQQVLQQAEAQLLDLAMEIAAKVLMQQVQAQKYEVEPIVRAALQQLPERTAVTVHLNPADHAQIIEHGGAGQLGEHVTLLADASVKPAECLLATEQGSVASSIAEGLAAVAAAMKDQQ